MAYDRIETDGRGCPYVQDDTGVHLYAEYTRRLRDWLSQAADGIAGAVAAVAQARELVASAPIRVASGRATVTVSGGVGIVNISFPGGRFTKGPRMACTTATAGARVLWRVTTVATGATITAWPAAPTGDGTFSCDWIAVDE